MEPKRPRAAVSNGTVPIPLEEAGDGTDVQFDNVLARTKVVPESRLVLFINDDGANVALVCCGVPTEPLCLNPVVSPYCGIVAVDFLETVLMEFWTILECNRGEWEGLGIRSV